MILSIWFRNFWARCVNDDYRSEYFIFTFHICVGKVFQTFIITIMGKTALIMILWQPLAIIFTWTGNTPYYFITLMQMYILFLDQTCICCIVNMVLIPQKRESLMKSLRLINYRVSPFSFFNVTSSFYLHMTAATF